MVICRGKSLSTLKKLKRVFGIDINMSQQDRSEVFKSPFYSIIRVRRIISLSISGTFSPIFVNVTGTVA